MSHKAVLFIPHSTLQFEVFDYWAEVCLAHGIKTICLMISKDLDRYLPYNHNFQKITYLDENDIPKYTDAILHLREFEGESKDTLWNNHWTIDRAFQNNNLTHEEATCLSSSLLTQIEKLISSNDIRLAISEKLFLPQRIIHIILHRQSIHHAVPISDRFFSRSYFQYGLNDWYRKSLLKSYKSYSSTYDYHPEVISSMQRIIYKNYKMVLDEIHNKKNDKNKYFVAKRPNVRVVTQDTIYGRYIFGSYLEPILKKVARRIKGRLWKREYNQLVSREVPKGKYLLYLFHMQPEYTVDGLATDYYNQIELVARIAKNLPSDVTLVIKENPLNIRTGKRHISEYNEIMRHPSIVFLHHELDAHELIKGSCGIITLTGTVGIEALMFGKKVFVLGKIFTRYFDGVEYCFDEGDLIKKLQSLELNDNTEIREDEALRILQAMYDNSYPAKMYTGFMPDRHRNPDNIQLLKNAFTIEFKSIIEEN